VVIPGGYMAAAVTYAVRGWSVFPLTPGTKEPLAFSQGFKDASSDVGTVARMWSAEPEANIGIATGAASGIWVLDIDTKEDKQGWESLRRLEELYGQIPITYTVRTYSGGVHMYFDYDRTRPLGRRINVFKRLNMPDIDICGDNGYVVAPPSTIGDLDLAYTVIDPAPIAACCEPVTRALAVADNVKPPRVEINHNGEVRGPTSHSIAGLLRYLREAAPGYQDDALTWVMLALRDEGYTAREADDLCWPIVANWPTSKGAWTHRDIERHLRSTYR
jgi:hypothetical protein